MRKHGMECDVRLCFSHCQNQGNGSTSSRAKAKPERVSPAAAKGKINNTTRGDKTAPTSKTAETCGRYLHLCQPEDALPEDALLGTLVGDARLPEICPLGVGEGQRTEPLQHSHPHLTGIGIESYFPHDEVTACIKRICSMNKRPLNACLSDPVVWRLASSNHIINEQHAGLRAQTASFLHKHRFAGCSDAFFEHNSPFRRVSSTATTQKSHPTPSSCPRDSTLSCQNVLALCRLG